MGQLFTSYSRQTLGFPASGFDSPAYSADGNVGRHLAWPVAIGLLLRITIAALLCRQFLNPARDHWEFGYEMGHLARSIVMGHGFSDPYWGVTGPSALVTPVYPYLLAGIFKVFGVFTVASACVMLLLNCLFSALTAIPIFYIARKTCDLQTARIATWVWTFFPYSINFSATTMWYHGFVALLLSALLLCALYLQSRDSLRSWAGFGMLFGFAALTNPVVVGTTPVIGIWLIVQLKRQGRRWIAASGTALIVMVMTVLPWSVRNVVVLHQAVPFKDGYWMEVCVGNVNDSVHWWDVEEHPSGSDREAREFQRLGEFRYMATKRERALSYIRSHPEHYAFRTLRRVVFMWTGLWSLNWAYLHQEPFDPATVVMATALSSLAFVGLLRLRSTRFKTLFWSVLFIFPLPYYLSHLDPGFRHPLDPLLVVLASSTVARWIMRPTPHVYATEEELAFQ